jgi:hypothetical protein
MNPLGMKRSLPCLELTSMDNMDSNPLFHTVNKRMKCCDDESAFVEISHSTAKNVRLPSMNSNPASSALESFLLIAVMDFAPLEEFAYTDDCSVSSLFMMPSCRHKSKTSSLVRKLEHHSLIPSVHDVTRGMARISASS